MKVVYFFVGFGEWFFNDLVFVSLFFNGIFDFYNFVLEKWGFFVDKGVYGWVNKVLDYFLSLWVLVRVRVLFSYEFVEGGFEVFMKFVGDNRVWFNGYVFVCVECKD